MPCVLQENSSIPLAYYGESNLGRLKTTYRNGLGYRYGRAMQTICAVHYNFSFSEAFWQWLKQAEGSTLSLADFQTARYFDMMRNFRRWSWLLIYLFGASPAVCNSFLKGRKHALEPFDEGTAYLPHATSLRSGNLGYQSDTQSDNLNVGYNSLEEYVASLANAICRKHPAYQDIGTLVEGEYRQVNANVLQSEAEFYSTIRAKRVPAPGQNFLNCLLDEGVQYIEVRLLDVNPYLPLGIDERQIKFLDIFLTYCLIADSPQHDSKLECEVEKNLNATVHEGRAPGLSLFDGGVIRSLQSWGEDLTTQLKPIADLLDEGAANTTYSDALTAQTAKLSDPSLTPSGTILSDLKSEQIPFFRFAMNQAARHKAYFESMPLDANELSKFAKLREESINAQQAVEAADNVSFDEYLAILQGAYKQLVR